MLLAQRLHVRAKTRKRACQWVELSRSPRARMSCANIRTRFSANCTSMSLFSWMAFSSLTVTSAPPGIVRTTCRPSSVNRAIVGVLIRNLSARSYISPSRASGSVQQNSSESGSRRARNLLMPWSSLRTTIGELSGYASCEQRRHDRGAF